MIEPTPEMASFLAERHLATLTLVRADGTPHVTPVGFTWEPATGLVRIITWAGAYKARLLERQGSTAAAVSQVDGGRWATIEGIADITADPERCAVGVRLYAERYRPPGDRGAERRVIELRPGRLLGRA